MKEKFESYLKKHGYKSVTPSGYPSTVQDYCYRINFVAKTEGISWEELAERIDEIIPIYDEGGSKQHLGKKSHAAVINALRRYSEFLKSCSL